MALMDMAVRTPLCSPLVLAQGGRCPVPTVGTAAWCWAGSLEDAPGFGAGLGGAGAEHRVVMLC